MIAEDLKRRAEDLWEKYVKHEFVERMRDDTLPVDSFKFYLVQDSLYVEEMVRSVIRAAASMPFDMAYEILSKIVLNRDKGMEVHGQLERELGITGKGKMTMTTYSYTRHLIYASTLGWPQFLAAWTPCMWGYSFIGKYVVATKNMYFKRWAEFYASDDYMERVSVILKSLDRFNGDASELSDLFKASVKYEIMFWQSALDNEPTI
ncbi:transcriptional activator tenA [Thermoplasma volcanium GSS1]|uniref:Transcriptional activator tenA n=1 Tax=Thermoplasma volcanium (strain ATCC 51530 / DSM 4299 / JCM 9571 / NBRC 15438 / GSS1) TaxID=273116 RepID=Q97CL8_THEVO|nr:TenA family protein [Thermoplasma volcanium]BAB59225.1 transcriptional activator tenA [Thermoplasma volcanium GSS1]